MDSIAFPFEKLRCENAEPHSVLYESFFHLYTTLFPKAERYSREQLDEFLCRGNGQLTLYHDSIDVIAFYLTERYVTKRGLGSEFYLLAYLGVKPSHQGRDIGGRILTVLKHLFKDAPLLLEAGTRQARWYHTHGYRTLPLDYRIPSYADDDELPMALMILGERWWKTVNTRDSLKQVVLSLYVDSYQLCPTDGRFVNQMSRISAME